MLINNVFDLADARKRADMLLYSDPRYHCVEFVADHLDYALNKTGLSRRYIRRLPHFTDCALVAVTLSGPTWLVYWDADAGLAEAHDWVTPTLAFIKSHPQIAVGNPNNWHVGLAEKEALSIEQPFAIGYGFSDVAFLAIT